MSNLKNAKISEHAHQVTLVNWFDSTYEQYSERLFAIPNGGKRDAVTGQKLKIEGVRKGVSDLMLPVPNNGYHGLFIEMKALKGVVSDEQEDWLLFFNEQGYKAEACYGWEQARDLIIDYLK